MEAYFRCQAQGCQAHAIVRLETQDGMICACQTHSGQLVTQLISIPQILAYPVSQDDTQVLKQVEQSINNICLNQIMQALDERNRLASPLYKQLQDIDQQYQRQLLAIRNYGSALRTSVRCILSTGLIPATATEEVMGLFSQCKTASQFTSENLMEGIQGQKPMPSPCSSLSTADIVQLCRGNNIFDGWNLEFLDFTHTDLGGGVFINCSFNHSCLEKAFVQNTILWNCSFEHSQLSKLNVRAPKRFVSGSVVAISPCSTLRVAASDSAIYLAEETAPFATKLADREAITALAFSSCSMKLFLAKPTFSIEVWDLITSDAVAELQHSGLVIVIEASPDGQWIAAGCSANENNLKVWKADTSEAFSITAHADAVFALNYSSCSQFLATSGGDSAVRLWKAASMELILALEHPSVANNIDNQIGRLCVYPVQMLNSELLITGGTDGIIREWDVASGNTIQTVEHCRTGIYSLALSKCQKSLAVASEKTLKIYSVSDFTCIQTIEDSDHVLKMAFSQCGLFLLCCTKNYLETFVNHHKLVSLGAIPKHERQYEENSGTWPGDTSVIQSLTSKRA